MRKTIITIIFLSSVIAASAQEFRGFVDAFAGRCLFKSKAQFNTSYDNISDITDDLTFGLYVTGGYQFTPQWFAGIGFGGYTDMLDWSPRHQCDDFESIYLPVYADVRWTLDLQRKITPYVDLKLGYQFGVDLGFERVSYHSSTYLTRIGYKGSMLLQPGVGVRFGKKSGFNLGLAYNAMIGKKIVEYNLSQPGVGKEIGSVNTGTLMLTFGADF